jgi:hypothetical protein
MDDQRAFEQLQMVTSNRLLRCLHSLVRIGGAVTACGPEQEPLVLAAWSNLDHLGALLEELADRFNAATDLTTEEAIRGAIDEINRATAHLLDPLNLQGAPRRRKGE